jgi:hypothetical protein
MQIETILFNGVLVDRRSVGCPNIPVVVSFVANSSSASSNAPVRMVYAR